MTASTPQTLSVPDMQAAIRLLAAERNAIILAHNYQVPEIQDVADYVGDSLGLAMLARSTNATIIVVCGVYFMAETAKILNPTRTVLIPDHTAGCSLADSITLQQLLQWKAEHPGCLVVSYVNTTAAIKAESDYCVTSGNAEAVIRSIPEAQPILFLPDMYLGTWLKEKTGRKNMEIWLGECHVHAAIRTTELYERMSENPDADLLIHPECGCTSRFVYASKRGAVTDPRIRVLSTEGMVKYAQTSEASTLMIATETGLLHRLQKEAPDKTFIAADNLAVCRYMKQITLPKLYDGLRHMKSEVTVPTETADRARIAIDRMLAIQP